MFFLNWNLKLIQQNFPYFWSDFKWGLIMEVFTERIIVWYTANKRDLPWRGTQNPYFIWLSEIILQQTRVDQGKDYYLRFIKEFPTIQQLAKADEEEVLKLWQGLGYYSRARNLHATARYISRDLKGVFPSEYAHLLNLKGIGEYTAAAIASFAFNKCHSVVDGNVFRVLSRVFGISTPIDSTEGKKEFRELAETLIDKKNPALFNQAIMEFGAMQCKPVNPDCASCCLQAICFAYSKNTVDQLPVKSKKTKQRDRFFNYLLLNYKGTVLLNKRTKKDIWENLYDFPLIETDTLISEQDFLISNEWKQIIGGQKFLIKKVSGMHKHILSHQKIYARFWEISLSKPFEKKQLLKEAIKITQSELPNYAIPRLIEIYLGKRD